MPLLNSVTTPYAEALLQVVNENSQTEKMVSDVKQLLELINDSPELEKALSSPILETDAKKKICLLYTSPSPRDYAASRMPSSA